jgi:hypothetical protein
MEVFKELVYDFLETDLVSLVFFAILELKNPQMGNFYGFLSFFLALVSLIFNIYKLRKILNDDIKG